LISERQVIQKAVDGWTESCPKGTSCQILRAGTTESGSGANQYVTDLLVSVEKGDYELYVLDGTRFVVRLSGTTNHTPYIPFNTYPRTRGTRTLEILCSSPSHGTLSLSACGFTAP
jgi:hypothetical protein